MLDENAILNRLDKFMISNNFLNLFNNKSYINENIQDNKIQDSKLNKNINKSESKDENEKYNKKKNDYITLHVKDKKFWYFYMFVNNLEYNDIPDKTNRFKIESDTKIKYVEEIMKNKELNLKQYKISKKNVQTSIADIQNCISLEDLIALCALYKRNLIYIVNNMYYEVNFGLTSGNNEYDVIIKDENNVEKIPLENKKEELLNQVKSEYYKIDNIAKKMKSISSYTLNELQEKAQNLNISLQTEEGKNKLKKIFMKKFLLN